MVLVYDWSVKKPDDTNYSVKMGTRSDSGEKGMGEYCGEEGVNWNQGH